MTNPTTTITYTDSQESPSGLGNIGVDPKFVDPAAGDYHEQSALGSWHNGAWTLDLEDSPCLDMGEPYPGSAYALEPQPNGKRNNMGAYGNTAQASKSLVHRGTMFSVR